MATVATNAVLGGGVIFTEGEKSNKVQGFVLIDPTTGEPTASLGGGGSSASITVTVVPLLASSTAIGVGSAVAGVALQKTYSVIGNTTSGAGSVAVSIFGSVDGVVFDSTPIGSITLTLSSTMASESFASNDRYPFVRASVTAISGTGSAVTAKFSY